MKKKHWVKRNGCLIKIQDPIKDPEAKELFKQIISGVEHMHKQGIVHRDLKLENIVAQNNADGRISKLKIIDFGFSEQFSDARPFVTGSGGAIAYLAPEVIERKPYQYLPEPVDVWACGVILFIIKYGRFPFYGKNHKEISLKIQKEDPHFPPEAYEYDRHQRPSQLKPVAHLINSMLHKEVEKRITIDQIHKHEWMQ